MSCLNLLERPKAEGVAADIAIHDYPPPGDHPVRRVAHALKTGDTAAIEEAALAMAERLPKGAVLVPMPNCMGEAGPTRKLADRIAEIAQATVVDALSGQARDSNYARKKAGKEPLRGAALLITQSAELTKGPVFVVDNVIGTGATMAAAQAALDRPSIALVYAKAPACLASENAAGHRRLCGQ